jgi:hypothetical protein
MADGKLYALPADAEAILVLDLNLEINGTEPWQDEPDHEERMLGFPWMYLHHSLCL